MKLGHVALDGTKVRANASRNKAMSYGRMKEKEAQLGGGGGVAAEGRGGGLTRTTVTAGTSVGMSCRRNWPSVRAGCGR